MITESPLCKSFPREAAPIYGDMFGNGAGSFRLIQLAVMTVISPLVVSPPDAFERGITTLISDAISTAIAAADHHDIDMRNTLARSSVSSSALYLEACANCCLDHLGLGTRLADELDRLPTLTKFDLYLHIRFKGRSLDRSRVEVQGYGELKTLRDAFVHPRAQRIEWLDWSEERSASTSPRSKSLKLAKVPAYLWAEDAVIALRAAHSFARYFFIDCARLRPSQVSALIHSESAVPDLNEKIYSCWSKSTRSWLKQHGVSLDYMKISWTNG